MQVVKQDKLPLTLKVEEVASILGISRGGAFNLVKSRGFPSIRIGRRIVIPKEAFFNWMEEKTKEPFYK